MSIALSFISTIIVGVCPSIIASVIFVHLDLARKVPKISISEFIAKEGDGDRVVYWFPSIPTFLVRQQQTEMRYMLSRFDVWMTSLLNGAILHLL